MSGSWIRHKKPSKFKNTKVFNANDPDSLANTTSGWNFNIVPIRGINPNWGLSEGSLIRKVEDIFKPADPKELDKRGEEYKEQRKKELAGRIADTKKKFKSGTRIWAPGRSEEDIGRWVRGIVVKVEYLLTTGSEGVFVLVRDKNRNKDDWYLPEDLRLTGKGYANPWPS